jgi:antitoxin ParD1/3/4
MQKTDTPAPVGATVTEVLRVELCSIEQREVENAGHLEALRAAVQLGAADIAAGRFKSFDTKASLRGHLQSVARQHGLGQAPPTS